ncbi:MAG TPA: Sip1-related alpha-galactosidase, partial [Polyangiaceae bacterium]|nr:Sip1-related alpha-galactosidase [Polyangiaceae bacterium]
SDKPDAHDFALLKELVLSDGSVLRARGVGLPTRDCLFADPLEDDALLKVFNHNEGSAVLGLFNARYREQGGEIAGSFSPSDVPDLPDGEFAVYLSRSCKLLRVTKNERIPLTLGALESEVATIVPLEQGLAVIGLSDKLNSGGAISERAWSESKYTFRVRDGGALLAYSERLPTRIKVDGQALTFEYDEGRLSFRVEKAGASRVEIEF